MRILKFFLAAIFFLASDSAFAQAYFEATTISPTLIEKPMDRSSAKYKNEVAQIIKMQNGYSRKELDLAISEIKITPDIILKGVDSKMVPQSFPKLFKLLERTTQTSVAVAKNFKHYWNTKRPYLENSKIKALVEKSESPSYPSGHTLSSFVLAKILGQLIPEQAQVFEAQANRIAQHRVLMGMHYPHDLEGGRQVGFLVVGALMQNEEFLSDFFAAKEELAKNYK